MNSKEKEKENSKVSGKNSEKTGSHSGERRSQCIRCSGIECLGISPMDSGLQIPNKAGRCARIRRRAGIEFLAKQGSFELIKLCENKNRIVSPTQEAASKQPMKTETPALYLHMRKESKFISLTHY